MLLIIDKSELVKIPGINSGKEREKQIKVIIVTNGLTLFVKICVLLFDLYGLSPDYYLLLCSSFYRVKFAGFHKISLINKLTGLVLKISNMAWLLVMVYSTIHCWFNRLPYRMKDRLYAKALVIVASIF